MPLELEMFLSASPPNYSIGLLHAGHFGNRNPGLGGHYSHRSNSCETLPTQIHSLKQPLRHIATTSRFMVTDARRPVRSILVSRSHTCRSAVSPELSTLRSASERVNSEGVPESDSLHKTSSDPAMLLKRKQVCFADDRGLALAIVRIMNESSDEPPTIKEDVLASVCMGACANAEPESPWKLAFNQPASDYLQFRSNVEKNMVALENVVLKEYQILGTAKVKNICFEKSVFVRVTFNGWGGYVDVPAVFMPSGITTGTSVFDTFSFELNIPPQTSVHQNIEFCICFNAITNGHEFWDNNGGTNYTLQPLVHDKTGEQQSSGKETAGSDGVKTSSNQYLSDPSTPNWGEFASWHNIEDNNPYW